MCDERPMTQEGYEELYSEPKKPFQEANNVPRETAEPYKPEPSRPTFGGLVNYIKEQLANEEVVIIRPCQNGYTITGGHFGPTYVATSVRGAVKVVKEILTEIENEK